MASLENEDYWEASKSSGFDFNEYEFVTIEKIENEKQEQLRVTTPSKSSSSAPPSFKHVVTNIFVPRDKVPVQSNVNLYPPIESSSFNSKSAEDIEKAVRALVLGAPTTLEYFKSLSDKLETLDEVLRWHDGNAIFTVLSFLKRTLKPSVFHQEIMKRPDALNHYLKLLALHQEYTVLCDVLAMLGRNEDAAIILYKNLMSIKSNPQTKLRNLKNFHNNHLKLNPDLNFIEKLIVEQMKLLEHQLPIEQCDEKQEIENKNLIFLEFPRSPLPGNSLMSTLHYCCLYHYHLPENNLSSPILLKKMYSLTDKQYTWVALQALIKNKLWKDIEALFETRSWIKGTKLTCCIGFDKVVKLLHRAETPVEEVTRYLNVLDSTQKLKLARKYKYHHIVVDTLVALRDRQELEVFRNQLIPNSREHLYASESLRASSIKWKN